MEAEILKTLKKAVLEYDSEAAERLAKRAMAEGIDPLKALAAMTEAIKEVGDGFGRGDLWLPDLTGAATAMEKALPVVEEAIKSSGKARNSLGVVVIGTVFGDIHTIGKGMVGTMLTAEGNSKSGWISNGIVSKKGADLMKPLREINTVSHSNQEESGRTFFT